MIGAGISLGRARAPCASALTNGRCPTWSDQRAVLRSDSCIGGLRRAEPNVESRRRAVCTSHHCGRLGVGLRDECGSVLRSRRRLVNGHAPMHAAGDGSSTERTTWSPAYPEVVVVRSPLGRAGAAPSVAEQRRAAPDTRPALTTATHAQCGQSRGRWRWLAIQLISCMHASPSMASLSQGFPRSPCLASSHSSPSDRDGSGKAGHRLTELERGLGWLRCISVAVGLRGSSRRQRGARSISSPVPDDKRHHHRALQRRRWAFESDSLMP